MEPLTATVPLRDPRRVDGPGPIVLMPSRGLVAMETMSSFITTAMAGIPFTFATCVRKPADEARNLLASQTVALLKDTDKWAFIHDEMFVLWIDDDAFWSHGMVAATVKILAEHPEIDILSGYYGPRLEYADARSWFGGSVSEDGDVVEVVQTWMHWVAHRAPVLDRVGPEPFTCLEGRSEDLSFSKRARDAGLSIYVAKRIIIPHVDAKKRNPRCSHRPDELHPRAHEKSAVESVVYSFAALPTLRMASQYLKARGLSVVSKVNERRHTSPPMQSISCQLYGIVYGLIFRLFFISAA